MSQEELAGMPDFLQEHFKNRMTPKQSLFVIEYLKDLNGTQAAIRAGYSEASANQIASENLGKPYIKKAIEDQMRWRAARAGITADYVLELMREISERCLQRKPVMVFNKVTNAYEQETRVVELPTGEFVNEGVWEFDSAGANTAAANLAKHLKLLTDKQEISGPDGQPLQPPSITVQGINPAPVAPKTE